MIIFCSATEVTDYMVRVWSWRQSKLQGKKSVLLSEGKEISVMSSFVPLNAGSRGHGKSQGSAHTRRGELSPARTLLTADLVTVCLSVA